MQGSYEICSGKKCSRVSSAHSTHWQERRVPAPPLTLRPSVIGVPSVEAKDRRHRVQLDENGTGDEGGGRQHGGDGVCGYGSVADFAALR